MKKINPELIRKLKSYSALAVPFVAGAGIANGQVVYTDIVPDTVLNHHGDTYNIDLNHDGVVDFTIRIGNAVYASNHVLAKFIAASAAKYNSIGGSTSGRYVYPAALNFGDMIGSDLTGLGNKLKWNAGTNQSAASWLQNTQSTNSYGSYGNWLNSTDQYMALRFLQGQSYYYGWLRMDSRVSHDTVYAVLKDFAYQSIGDSSIAAGDTGSAVTGLHNVSNNLPVKINYFNHEVYITSPQNSIGAMAIEVFDMEGRRLLEYNTSQKEYQFSTASLPAGLFLVRVTQSGKTYTKKISLR